MVSWNPCDRKLHEKLLALCTYNLQRHGGGGKFKILLVSCVMISFGDCVTCDLLLTAYCSCVPL